MDPQLRHRQTKGAGTVARSPTVTAPHLDSTLQVDEDVLFAAAFLRDMAAFMPCEGPKMEHGACAARQARAVLRSTGFPMQKLAAVQAAERGDMYYSTASDPDAVVLHDADSLDFLGDIGAQRAAQLRSFLDELQAESFGGRAM